MLAFFVFLGLRPETVFFGFMPSRRKHGKRTETQRQTTKPWRHKMSKLAFRAENRVCGGILRQLGELKIPPKAIEISAAGTFK